MKKGDVIEVYQDPFTKKHLEGKARLISRCIKARRKHDFEYWKVKFLLDGAIVYRHVG